MFASQTTCVVVTQPTGRVGKTRGCHGRRVCASVRASGNADRDRVVGTHDHDENTLSVPVPPSAPTNRRGALVGFAVVASSLAPSSTQPARAIGFTKELKKKDVSEDDYRESAGFEFRGEAHAGVKFYDIAKGGGDLLEPGKTAVVHYTCRYRGLTAVSSREARTLGGNRTVAEPLEFKFGKLPSEYAKPLVRKTVVGIGAEVRIDPELEELYVVTVVFDGPAAKAGIKAQDTIVTIDGVGDLLNVPISEIGALLQGE